MDTYSRKFQPVITPPWNPSRARFERYLAREVEMCRVNMARGRGSELHSEHVRSIARKARVDSVRIDRVDGDTMHATVDVRAAGYVPQVTANITVRTKLDGRWIGQA